MGLPRADLSLGEKLKKTKLNKNLNFEFMSWVQICRRNPAFPTTQNPKKGYFLYAKIFLIFSEES